MAKPKEISLGRIGSRLKTENAALGRVDLQFGQIELRVVRLRGNVLGNVDPQDSGLAGALREARLISLRDTKVPIAP